MRVLVVEDEPGLGDLLGDFLLELGHRPLVVRSAEAARGTPVELVVEGLKARLDASLTPRSVVRLSFTPPDAGSAITVVSLVIRADPDGHAFAFVHLPEADTERLRDLIRRRPSR